jgi:nitrite reductase (NO-forming)
MHLTRMHMIIAAALVTIVFVGSFSAAGIFDQDKTPSRPSGQTTASTGTPSAADSANAPVIELVDIAFTPRNLTIPANTPTVITLVNNGAAVHNLSIDELNVHSGDMEAGETTTVTINAPAGTYTYYCTIPGHRTAGMVGTLTVT